MVQKIIIPSLLASLFTVIFSLHSINRHFTFSSHAFDLGIYTQAIYLYSQNLTPFSTLKHMIILADHFGPILLLLSPIYKLFPSANTLFIMQSFFVSLSSIPIYLIALNKLKNTFLSFLITLAYLTSPAIISAVNFDFHLTTISVLPLALMLYCLDFKYWRLYWIILFLSLFFKEDIPIFILGLGIYALFIKKRGLGIATIFFALTSFYLIKFTIMPFLWNGSENSYISTSTLPISSPIDMILLIIIRPNILWEYFFNSPIKLATIDTLLRPFAFLSIISPLSWLTVIPYLFFRFSSTYTHLWGTTYHHSANMVPFLAVSMIFTVKKFKIPTYPIIFLLLFFLFSDGLLPDNIIGEIIQKPLINRANFNYLEVAIIKIPSNAAVSAQSPILPHLANREKIYLYPEIYDADYIILDYSLSSYPIQLKTLKDNISLLKKSKSWKIFNQQQTLIIFKRNN